jgi:NAD(P)-dependent dehydrogenase (short-subunit alcohol dehydrogenase family)
MTSSFTPESISLTGQVALITGGGRGLGRLYAQWLARAGAAVGIMARSAEQLEETARLVRDAGGRALAFPGDVADQQTVNQAVAAVEAAFGPLTLLVNNAGVNGPSGRTWEIDPAEWWRCMEINLRGPLACMHAVLPGMVARGHGRVINVSSGAGNGPTLYGSAYGVSKTALSRLSETIALEVAEFGVQVFPIQPGTVRTAMTEELLNDPLAHLRVPWLPDFFAQQQDSPPERAAELVLRLASGEADALSGVFLGVDNDLDALIRDADTIRQRGYYTLRLHRPA